MQLLKEPNGYWYGKATLTFSLPLKSQEKLQFMEQRVLAVDTHAASEVSGPTVRATLWRGPDVSATLVQGMRFPARSGSGRLTTDPGRPFCRTALPTKSSIFNCTEFSKHWLAEPNPF